MRANDCESQMTFPRIILNIYSVVGRETFFQLPGNRKLKRKQALRLKFADNWPFKDEKIASNLGIKTLFLSIHVLISSFISEKQSIWVYWYINSVWHQSHSIALIEIIWRLVVSEGKLIKLYQSWKSPKH